ncbi:MAG TPA: chemotaxis protein CheW [Gemmatimonadaceae bacterium]|nr:chemotaxis protein CheW [Gemmatimonadaceae bacterium]
MPATLPSPSDRATDAASDGAGVAPSLVRFRDRVRARSGMAELLAFRVGAERYAFDVRALDEALDAPPIDRVAAHETSILAGLLRLSGVTIPVFDAGRLLGAGASQGGQVLVLRGASRRMALLVDDVHDVVALDLGGVRPPPFEASDDLLLGVVWDGASLTSILDARAIVSACQQRPTGGSA